jgi:DNA-binding XRE family transcriptional regulator
VTIRLHCIIQRPVIVNAQPDKRCLFVDSRLAIEESIDQQTDAAEPRVGSTIRRLRHAAGYSQESLARLVGVDRTRISILEEDEDTASMETLCLVAVALGTKASHILAQAGF